MGKTSQALLTVNVGSEAIRLPVSEIAEATVRMVRKALEPVWPAWKAIGGYDCESDGVPSRDCCVATSFALRDALRRTTPEVHWKVTGGRPTRRTPKGGYLDKHGVPHAHLWVEGRIGSDRIIADITADQFGGAPIICEVGHAKGYTANATKGLLRYYEAHQSDSIKFFLEVIDAQFRRG